jgi:hypothetical protein
MIVRMAENDRDGWMSDSRAARTKAQRMKEKKITECTAAPSSQMA